MPPLLTPDVEWGLLAPELILIGGALILLVAGTFPRRRDMGSAYALLTILVAGGVAGQHRRRCGRTSPGSGPIPAWPSPTRCRSTGSASS